MYLGHRSSKFHFDAQKLTKNDMGHGYIQCKFSILGPQIGPQIIIFEKNITSSFTGTKNQIKILYGDLSLHQISMSENVLFSMISSDFEVSKFHVP